MCQTPDLIFRSLLSMLDVARLQKWFSPPPLFTVLIMQVLPLLVFGWSMRGRSNIDELHSKIMELVLGRYLKHKRLLITL